MSFPQTNKEAIFLIFEQQGNDAPSKPVSYARTTFEARRAIVGLARSFLQTKTKSQDEAETKTASDTNVNDISPLWLGQEPKEPGLTMFYTFPGPNESSIRVNNVQEYKPLIWGKSQIYEAPDDEYKVWYEQLSRCNVYQSTSSSKPNKDLPTDASFLKKAPPQGGCGESEFKKRQAELMAKMKIGAIPSSVPQPPPPPPPGDGDGDSDSDDSTDTDIETESDWSDSDSDSDDSIETPWKEHSD